MELLQEATDRMQRSFNGIPDKSSPRGSIFRVPITLSGADREAYCCLGTGIGCYWINDNVGKVGEFYYMITIECVYHFLNHAEKKNTDLFSLLKTINQKYPQIREQYSDEMNNLDRNPRYNVNNYGEHFTEQILRSCAYLIELFRSHWHQCHPSQDDQCHLTLNHRQYRQSRDILRDILLLENQLPFFILRELYGLVYNPCPGGRPYFTDIACEFLGLEDRTKVAATGEAQCHHLLDLVRSYYAPSNGSQIIDIDYRKRRDIVSPTATALYEAGIKFKVATDDNTSKLLDIHFDKVKGILTIPKLGTEDQTISLFINMAAYEQLMRSFDQTYISDYLYFLDCLINTPRDVELLIDAGIVVNCLGCEVVCGMFNGISKNYKIDRQKYIYAELSEQLIDHCKDNWNRHKATLKNKYFGHPWAMISLIYATILLILTLIQTGAGILAVPGVLK